ncbi:uncharacterized protein LOC135371566 [Ornithodoros turicata]|uniref:uncharacterized protein LOC135371566 n=1 Tax=Ornithodoros turicata TaxID=34597 RepID=UPI003139FB12
MEVFLKKFVKQCSRLADKGFKWIKNGVQVVSKAFVVCCSVDSAARPLLQNMIKFNGFFGCSWCLHPGVTVKGDVRYTVTSQVHEERKASSSIRCMYRAAAEHTISFGFKGPSALLNLPGFDVISSFVPDYLHCILLGVARTMMKLWFDSKYSGEGFYIGAPAAVERVDSRIRQIKPPSAVGRYPRSVTERKLWKGQEFRSWLLYYSLPVLCGILPRQYLLHLSLLVRSLFLLLQDSLTYTDINTAQDLLTEFVVKYNMLYGDYNMVYNVHILLHIPRAVANWGPLWAHSTFVFESFNGVFVKSVKGNRGVAEQVLQKAMLRQSIYTYVQMKGTAPLKLYASALKNLKKTSFALHISEATLLGRGLAPAFNMVEKSCIRASTGAAARVLSVFSRMIYHGTVFHSTTYTRPKKTNDSVVRLSNGKYALIQAIFSYATPDQEKEVGLLVYEMEAFESSVCSGSHMVRGQFTTLRMHPVSAICRKAIAVVIDGVSHVCHIPNQCEVN